MNWRKLLYATSTSFLRICRSRSVSREKSSTPRCLIFDDTLLYKTGKVIEGVSKVYDHVSHCTHLGYKLLGMVYYDGISAILTDFSLHRELGKKGMGGLSTKQWKHQYHPKRSSSQPDCIRRQELDMSKMEKMYQMLRSAFRQGFEVDYVLTDNWFTCAVLLHKAAELWRGKVHVIGLCKMNAAKYEVGGKKRGLEEIKRMHERKSRHYCRKIKSSYITVKACVDGVPVKMFFIHYEKQPRWTLMITTDTELGFSQAFQTYSIRWNIEILWKECKQYLDLGMYQGRNLNGQIADCTLAFITHTMLTLEKRFSEYEIMGELFREVEEQVRTMTLWERMLPILYQNIELLLELIGYEPEYIMKKISGNKRKFKKYKPIWELLQYKDKHSLRLEAMH